MRLSCLMAVSAAGLWAQSNQMQICDQGAPGSRHCVIWKAPASLPLSPAPVTVSGKSGGVIFGLDYTDMSILPGAVVSGDAFISASSATNASILSMAATPATGGADISVGKTGSGTLLPLRFLRNPDEVMRIDVNNLLLLGRTADDGTGAKFQVKGDVSFQTTSTATQHGLMLDQYTTDTVPAHLLLDKARGTSASPSIVANGDGIGAILFRAHNGSSFQVPADVFAKAVVSGGNIGADLFFDTRAPGGALTDRMVITNAGHVLIGSTTDDGSGNALQLTGGCSGCGVVWPLVVPGGTAAPQIDATALAGRLEVYVPNSFQINHTDGEGLVIDNVGGASTTEGYILMHAGSRGEVFRIRATSISSAAADKSAVLDAPGALYYGVDYQTARHYFYGASIFLGLGTSGGAWTGNVYVNTASDDGSGARLQLAGYMSASSGYYSASTASNAINVPAGGALLAGVETVTNNNSSPRGLISSEYTSSNFAAALFFRKAGGTSASPTTVADGDTISSITSSAYNGSSWQYPAYVAVRANVSGANIGSDMAFAVRPIGGSLVERLLLTNGGDVVVTDNTGEIARFGESRRLQLGLATSDVSSGIGSLIASNTIVSVTGASNASLISMAAVAGNYGAIAVSKTGSGTYLPFALFTSATERMRVATNGHVLVNRTTDDSTSSDLQVAGKISLSSTLSFLGGSIDASGIGGALSISTSATGSGNVVLALGDVSGASSLVVQGHSHANLAALGLVINEVGATAGAGVTLAHGATFDAAWQAGTGAAFDVVDNTSTHRLVVLQGGKTLVGRTTDDGTGSLFQVNGTASFAGNFQPTTSNTYNNGTSSAYWAVGYFKQIDMNGGSGIVAPNGSGGYSGTITIRNSAGTGTCTLTYSGGVLTATSC